MNVHLESRLPHSILHFAGQWQWEGRCKATWKREFKLPWREARPPHHLDDKVDSDQKVVNKEVFLSESGCVMFETF